MYNYICQYCGAPTCWDSKSQSFICISCGKKKLRNNYDWLTSLTPEQLARWIDIHEAFAWCPENAKTDPETKECLEEDDCWKCILKWLEKEHI